MTERPPARLLDRAYVRYAVFLLAGINVLNQLDRFVIAILTEPIRRELALSDTQMGLVTGFAFAIFYALAGIPLARIADRGHRPRLIAVCIAVWSMLTMATGAVHSFLQLAITRIGVAAGEAGGQPASHSMIADLVPAERRSFAFGIFAAGGAIGVMLALQAGGLLAAALGWRWSLFIIGMIGLPVAALTAWTLQEPRRCGLVRQPTPTSIVAAWQYLSSSHTYLRLCVSVVLCVIPGFAIAAWAPAFFMRSHNLSVGQVGLWLGLAAGIGNLSGALLSGWLGDRVSHRSGGALLVASGGMLLAGPAFTFAFLTSNPILAIAFWVVPTTLHAMWFAPLFASIQATTAPPFRAQAAALTLFLVQLLGAGLGPTITGVLSDVLRPAAGEESLRYALIIAANASFISAITIWLASRQIRPTNATTR